ncbi:hypothetical protein Lbir_0049 [Legionella birminghamensis]|uniref:Uncharacterized protein n=1 Tax=Legionella birminghamensis TaxID=28083 RepID=A0A378IB37_9GAMM|nr:hypothetical protein [Legionella birminghamensis]KTC75980.1 hypothetical protein Lbir_0049 [Legionella birminghamensis]STX32106.1 Uncharacterised protein [Legionella birminghamensis]
MSYNAAIRWLPRGYYKLPVIQYLLLDEQLEYLISPAIIEVYDLKSSVTQVLDHIERLVPDKKALKIHFKSITKSYGRHRRDSLQFDRLIRQWLIRNHLLEPNSRTAILLKKTQLKLFKDALYLLDIDCKTRGQAFVAHLWSIALKATPKRIPEVIKTIWKSRYGIKRMTPEYLVKYNEFYAHLQ